MIVACIISWLFAGWIAITVLFVLDVTNGMSFADETLCSLLSTFAIFSVLAPLPIIVAVCAMHETYKLRWPLEKKGDP